MLRFLLLILSLALSASAFAQSTVTLQQGPTYTGTTDAWIIGGSGADWTKGAENEFEIRDEASDSTVVRFAIFARDGGPVPDGATINSATLSLYKYAGPDGTFKASRLLKDWKELEVSWNRTATNPNPLFWSIPGARGADSDYVANADQQPQASVAAANGCLNAPYPAACWLNLDVTASTRLFASGAAPNFGWKIAQINADPGDPNNTNAVYKNFVSKDNLNFTDLRPKLTISYSGSGGPGVPTASFTSSQNAGTLGVTFNASGTTDGGSPIIDLRLQFGDGQEVTWTNKNQTQSHTYASAGPYTATLTARNAVGTSAPFTRTFTVSGGPAALTANLTATPPGGIDPASVEFSAAGSTQGSAPITSLRLEFGHQNQEVTWSDKNAKQFHTYPAGTFTARLTVTDANGQTNSTTKAIQVDAAGSDILPTSQAAGPLGSAVPTFHSMGLYYNPASPPSNGKVWMRYRKASESNIAWQDGYPLWFDTRSNSARGLPYTEGGQQYPARGSAVNLQPGVKYYFEFGTGGQSPAEATWQHYVAGTTWSAATFRENPNKVIIPPQTGAYVIAADGGGAADAYKVYDGWNGSSKNVVDGGGAGTESGFGGDASHAIVVKASFVIIRRVRATGAATAGIFIAPGVTDVVIEDSQVDDWAWRPETGLGPNPNAWGTFGWNEAGGIHLGGNNSRIVIQRNIITSPHFGSFPWDTGSACGANNHPAGPMGISIQDAGAQNVIRYNEITGEPGNNRRWYQDAIGGGTNFSEKGAPGADSDIYQNIIMHAFDDAIEAEGGGRNVRIWGNYISDAKSAVAGTTVHFGPTYAWRNVFNRLRMCYNAGPDVDGGPSGFKFGGLSDVNGYGAGARYLFHNTMLQEAPAAPQGNYMMEGVEAPSNDLGSVKQTTTRNNIFHVKRPTDMSILAGDRADGSDFNFDVYNGRLDGAPSPEQDSSAEIYKFTEGQLFYKPGHGPSSVPALGGGGIGNYQLGDNSKGIGVGELVPNFSGVASGTAPDAGAHQRGAPAMTFGISAQ
jgi:PKD repeat protein